MSDYAHSDRHSKLFAPNWTIETRAMFAACYLLLLFRAAIYRAMPWRKPRELRAAGRRESIFSEAASAASVIVTSSFTGM